VPGAIVNVITSLERLVDEAVVRTRVERRPVVPVPEDVEVAVLPDKREAAGPARRLRTPWFVLPKRAS
jgi:hypothetical protein